MSPRLRTALPFVGLLVLLALLTTASPAAAHSELVGLLERATRAEAASGV